jgi:cation diffusion facilitator family transporter
MKDCCGEEELGALGDAQARVLKIVLAVNAAMFLAEAAGGLLARSTALLGDSLDMLEDAAVYAVSLYVLRREPRWKTRAARLKGLVMLALGAAVLVQAVLKAFSPAVPDAETMGAVGLLALIANAFCLFLLYKHKGDDLNMRSTWLCSRNDVLANMGVLVAAALVHATGSKWPDVLVGGAIAALILTSSFSVLKEAKIEGKGERRQP